jgi:hypothetical protein
MIEPFFEVEAYRRLRARVKIDLIRIDDELCETPFLIQEAGEYACSSVDARDIAKDELERIRSEAASKLRDSPPPEGKKAPSEAMIDSILPQSKTVQEAQDVYAKACLDARLWQNLADTLSKKSFSMQEIGKLLLGGFLAPNSIRDRRREEIRNANPAPIVARTRV